MPKLGIILASFATLIVSTGEANGGMITDRSALSNLLGGSGIIEDFETGTYGETGTTGFGFVWGGNVLDSDTIVPGLGGPGLVVPGVTFIAPSNMIFGAAGGEREAPSQEIGFDVGETFVIDFASPTRAFGFDLRNASQGIADEPATLQIFAGDDTTLIGTLSIDSLTGTPIFVGFEDAGGIGKVEIIDGPEVRPGGGIPMIDNLEFASSSAVPEPSSVVLFGLGTVLIFAAMRRPVRKKKASVEVYSKKATCHA